MDLLKDVPSFDFVIPFRPFERHLLEGIRQAYTPVLIQALKDFKSLDDFADVRLQQPLDDEEQGVSNSDAKAETYVDAIDELKNTLFRGWNELWDIQFHFTVVDGEKILRDPTGTRTRADIDAIQKLKRTGSIGRGKFSQKMLCEYNSSFLDHFVAEPLPRINFIPAVSDASYWDILAGIAVAGHYTHLVDVIRNSTARFDVWKVVYQFTLSNRRPDNGQNVYEQFMLSAAFSARFILKPEDEPELEGEDIVIQNRHSEHEQADLDFFDDEFPSAWDSQQPLEDPRSYIEIIPWDELEPITVADLEKGGVDSFLPYHSTCNSNDDPFTMPKWMLWKLPSTKFFDSHTLHVDDEIYQYCIVNNWQFPGHLLNNRVAFALSPLEVTEFVANLKHFWDYWNDCALAVNPSDNQLYLLETIPGRQYRMRQKFQDFTAAPRYFQNLVEDHVRPTDSDANIRAILGSDYKPKYQSMLRYIPPQQFLHIDTEILGEGQNGAVYGAIWERPAPVLCGVQAQEASFDGPGLPVVVKRIKPKSSNSGRVQKIIRELDMTFTALGGFHFGCVKFLGVTSFPVNDDSEKQLFLVFERASEGNLLDFLERRLEGITGAESWAVILEVLCTIAHGLANIHNYGIIHGDLHPKNILVNKPHYSDGPVEGSIEFDILISDFGEGKRLGDGDQYLRSTSGNFACAIGDFMPKEVAEEGGWSAKSDVFSFGRVAELMLRIRVNKCTIAGSEDERAMPRLLKSTLEKCLAEKAAERPQMSSISRGLDDLCSQIEDDEAEWTTIEMDNNLEAGGYSSFSTELRFSSFILTR